MADSVRKGLSMGDHTFEVPLELFAENRRRLCARLRNNPELPECSMVLLQGGCTLNHYDTDVEYVFRQEPYFLWACGVTEPGCYLGIQVPNDKAILFVPKLDPSYAVWMGPLLTLEDFRVKYGVGEVHYVEDIRFIMKKKNPWALLTLFGQNTDSGLLTREAAFDGINEYNVDNTLLYPEITECRVFKTDLELQLMRYVNKVSSDAHMQVMRKVRPGMKEYQGEAIFLQYAYYVGGCRHVSYTCICGSGQNSAILHYGHAGAPNDKTMKDGDMCLFDMGASYWGYASDITCSYPVNGKFTDDQRIIYNAVLKASKAVMDRAKPGVSWVEMHRVANRAMLAELRDKGILKGNVEHMLKAGLAAIFQPHGLGHLMGLDVHDVGGYPEGHPERPAEPGMNKLRTARVLQKGMVLTIEPGCYFIPALIDQAMNNPEQAVFLVEDAIERLRGFGGVRIEDDVVVTETGVENMTKVPRTVEEIEAVMASRNLPDCKEL